MNESKLSDLAILAIEGMQFYAFHGFYEAERKIGGEYAVDVYATIPDNAGAGDELDNTLNYETIYAITEKIMQQPVKLIEYIAQQILEQLRLSFPETENFKVKVKKFRPPLNGEVNCTYFELEG